MFKVQSWRVPTGESLDICMKIWQEGPKVFWDQVYDMIKNDKDSLKERKWHSQLQTQKDMRRRDPPCDVMVNPCEVLPLDVQRNAFSGDLVQGMIKLVSGLGLCDHAGHESDLSVCPVLASLAERHWCISMTCCLHANLHVGSQDTKVFKQVGTGGARFVASKNLFRSAHGIFTPRGAWGWSGIHTMFNLGPNSRFAAAAFVKNTDIDAATAKFMGNLRDIVYVKGTRNVMEASEFAQCSDATVNALIHSGWSQPDAYFIVGWFATEVLGKLPKQIKSSCSLKFTSLTKLPRWSAIVSETDDGPLLPRPDQAAKLWSQMTFDNVWANDSALELSRMPGSRCVVQTKAMIPIEVCSRPIRKRHRNYVAGGVLEDSTAKRARAADTAAAACIVQVQCSRASDVPELSFVDIEGDESKRSDACSRASDVPEPLVDSAWSESKGDASSTSSVDMDDPCSRTTSAASKSDESKDGDDEWITEDVFIEHTSLLGASINLLLLRETKRPRSKWDGCQFQSEMSWPGQPDVEACMEALRKDQERSGFFLDTRLGALDIERLM